MNNLSQVKVVTTKSSGGACRTGGFAFKSFTVTLALLVSCASFSACSRTEPKSDNPPEKVTIAYAALVEATLAHVAQAGGYYRDEGLEVTRRLHSYGKLALEDVLEGKADFATVAETPAMLAIMNGQKIAIIATIQSSQKSHAIVARKDFGILVPQDLKGKKIATTLGTTADFFLDGYLTVHGIARQDLTVVNLKPEELRKSLQQGEVAAVSAFHPSLYQTQKALGDRGITFYDEDICRATFNVAATQEFIRKNPDKVEKMLRALVRAEKLVKENPAQAKKMVAQLTGIAPEIIAETWDVHDFALTLNQSLILVLEDESQWAIKNKIISTRNMPNYLDYIYFDGLDSVKPEAVRILR